jgi:uncharacterized protein YfaS (alpha-2-macroglobulin family)
MSPSCRRSRCARFSPTWGIDLDDVNRMRRDRDMSHLPIAYQVEYRNNPAFDDAKLTDVIEKGLARLYDFQRPDGAWGWWKGGPVDTYMTAYVLQGLLIAKRGGVEVDEARIDRAFNFLVEHFGKEDNTHRAAYIAYALSDAMKGRELDEEATAKLKDYVLKVYAKREYLSNYTRAQLLLALVNMQMTEQAEVVTRNMMSYYRGRIQRHRLGSARSASAAGGGGTTTASNRMRGRSERCSPRTRITSCCRK